jgi:hypothetical protein
MYIAKRVNLCNMSLELRGTQTTRRYWACLGCVMGHFFKELHAIWIRGLERWYLVLGGVAVGRGFENVNVQETIAVHTCT